MLEGPKSDFGGFLAACDELHKNVEYLTLNRSLKASDTALNQARELFGKGMSRLEEEFKVLLTSHRSVVPGNGSSYSIFSCCRILLFSLFYFKSWISSACKGH